jgi:hypothetical protein
MAPAGKDRHFRMFSPGGHPSKYLHTLLNFIDLSASTQAYDLCNYNPQLKFKKVDFFLTYGNIIKLNCILGT